MDIGERFEKEFGARSDYFNHRIGLFMDMKKWVEDETAKLKEENERLREQNAKLTDIISERISNNKL